MTIISLFLFLFSPTDLYNQANKYYGEKNYTEAITLYQKASENLQSADLYYNLGNANFKINQIGKAILNYQRARFLSPRDADINYNLKFARNFRVDKQLTIKNPFAKFITKIFHHCSLLEAQIFATVFFIFTSILLSCYIIGQKRLFSYSSIVTAVLFLFFFINSEVWRGERNSHAAVIVVPQVNALSGPGEEYQNILVIHDGTEVRIRERRGEYALIQLPGGTGGWIKKSAIEEIF